MKQGCSPEAVQENIEKLVDVGLSEGEASHKALDVAYQNRKKCNGDRCRELEHIHQALVWESEHENKTTNQVIEEYQEEFGNVVSKVKVIDQPDQKIESLSDGIPIFRKHTGDASERLAVAYLDSGNRVLGIQTIDGEVGSVDFNEQKIIRTALVTSASAIIVAHNHPSGDSSPSQGDIEVTRELDKTLNNVGIQLLDHIIIADFDETSLKANNYF